MEKYYYGNHKMLTYFQNVIRLNVISGAKVRLGNKHFIKRKLNKTI